MEVAASAAAVEVATTVEVAFSFAGRPPLRGSELIRQIWAPPIHRRRRGRLPAAGSHGNALLSRRRRGLPPPPEPPSSPFSCPPSPSAMVASSVELSPHCRWRRWRPPVLQAAATTAAAADAAGGDDGGHLCGGGRCCKSHDGLTGGRRRA
ncbi:hypothetical protein ACP4OV_026448 [Aristida adscensionis]